MNCVLVLTKITNTEKYIHIVVVIMGTVYGCIAIYSCIYGIAIIRDIFKPDQFTVHF